MELFPMNSEMLRSIMSTMVKLLQSYGILWRSEPKVWSWMYGSAGRLQRRQLSWSPSPCGWSYSRLQATRCRVYGCEHAMNSVRTFRPTVHCCLAKQHGEEAMTEGASLLRSLGISDNLKKKDVIAALSALVAQARSQMEGGQIDRTTGRLLYNLAARFRDSSERSTMLVDYICSKKVISEQQLTAALGYLQAHPMDPVDIASFEQYCGIGVTVSQDELTQEVKNAIERYRSKLLEKRNDFPVGMLIGAVRKKLRWTDPESVRLAINQELTSLLGQGNANSTDETSQTEFKREHEIPQVNGSQPIGEARRFHRPGENYLTDGYVVTPKTMDLLSQHVKETGGKVVTRFPPEPNGILHIGHAMAINFNFGYAKTHGGITYLRYDDTDPEKEEERFIKGIQEMVEWLGHKPYKITHASDYFPRLYQCAVQLIRQDQAYVCHQTQNELRGLHPPPSPWRDRPVEESLQLFEDMKNGKFKEGEATVRMKLRMEDSKQDPVAYRIKHIPHPRTGHQWCVYPTYDFAHCLCDSFENITHSLCTKEFQIKRSAYYWLCNTLGVYCPVQWEFGRLNLHYTVVSKRKIQKLISAGIVSDWDDPRLFTLPALRRRGFPAKAINKFCAEYGVMVSEGAIYPELVESFVRDELNRTATRVMAVLEPIKVVITNFPHSSAWEVEVPNIPGDPSRGSHQVPLDRVLYIEQSDFRQSPEQGYRRLSPDQPVGLKHASLVISIEEAIKDSSGKVTELHVTCQRLSECAVKPRAFIHWVSEPLACTVRLYNRLFLHESPEQVPGGYLSDVNPESMQVIWNAKVDRTMVNTAPLENFQFERLGYFCVDPTTTGSQLVFNRTVTLREDSSNPVPIHSYSS